MDLMRAVVWRTSRDRHKSAPYLRLKNSKRTSKSQSIPFYSTWKTQKVGPNWRAKRAPFRIFNIHCCKTSKNWRALWWIFFESLTMPKKRKGRTRWDFQHPFCRKTSKKLKGDLLGIFFESRKNWKVDPLVSPGIVCYAEKEEKPFWSRSLGQMIQFGTIKFRRTL